MRGLIALPVLAVLLYPSSSAAATSGRLCEHRPGTTLAAGPQVRVLSVPGKDPYRAVLACAVGSRRAVRLGGAGECQNATQVGTAVVAGRYAAFTTISCGLQSGTTSIGLFDARRGAVLWRQAAYAEDPPGGEDEIDARDLAVNPSGAVAWLGVLNSARSEVHVRRPAGTDRVLDSGTAAGEVSDVALGAGRVYWTHGPDARSAPTSST